MSKATATLPQLKALHDLQLAMKPEFEHEPCPLCDATLEEIVGDTDVTFTEEQVQARIADAVSEAVAAAVAEATGPLQATIDQLNADKAGSDLDKAVADATAELRDQVAALTDQVTEAEAKATAADERANTLQATIDEATEKEAAAGRKDDRVQAVKDLDFWTESFIDERADEWASLDDEAWDAELKKLEDLRDGARTDSRPPATRSAFTATAQGGGGGGESKKSASSRLIAAQAAAMTSGKTGN